MALTGGRDEGGEVGDGGLTARAYRSDKRRALKRRCPRRVKACLHSAVATGTLFPAAADAGSAGTLLLLPSSGLGTILCADKCVFLIFLHPFSYSEPVPWGVPRVGLGSLAFVVAWSSSPPRRLQLLLLAGRAGGPRTTNRREDNLPRRPRDRFVDA